MKGPLLWFSAVLFIARPAFAQNAPQLVPGASISPQAVTSVPAPFERSVHLICYNSAGQGLIPCDISAANEAALLRILAAEVQPQFIKNASIAELDAFTSAGELKQEFLISPADPVAADHLKVLMECHQFCQGNDQPWIMAVEPTR